MGGVVATCSAFSINEDHKAKSDEGTAGQRQQLQRTAKQDISNFDENGCEQARDRGQDWPPDAQQNHCDARNVSQT
jgi:hypothetical protein